MQKTSSENDTEKTKLQRKGISGLLQQPQNKSKPKGLTACNAQTTNSLGWAKHFTRKYWAVFLKSVHKRITQMQSTLPLRGATAKVTEFASI